MGVCHSTLTEKRCTLPDLLIYGIANTNFTLSFLDQLLAYLLF